MGISRTEVNLLRLLDSAPRQKNQAKLVHPDDAKEVQDTIEEQSTPEEDRVGSSIDLSLGVTRRFVSQIEDGQTVSEKERDVGVPITLDAGAQAYFGKHRKLQDDLTDEIVVLA